jgi:protein SCO1/2
LVNQQSRKISWLLWAGVALLLATLALAFLLAQLKSRVAQAPLPDYGTVADFTLTNQNGTAISLDSLRGHPWVADVIFTRCMGPCPRMTRQMKEIQDALPPQSRTHLVTLTADPAFDTPPVLKKYAERFGADTNRWTFLTGTKRQILDLAADSLKLTAIEKEPDKRENENDLFIHSTIFVLVDGTGRLRGIFETGGEGVDFQKVKSELLGAIRRLERGA